MEKFDDLVDGQGHVVRVLEGMVGPFDGDELDDVIFGEVPDQVDRNHFVLRAVEDEDVVGKIEIFVVADVETLEVIHESLVDLHLAVETDLDFLAFLQLGKAFVGNVIAHAFIHVDARAAQGDFFEGIALFDEVAQGNVGAEARRIVVDVLGLEFGPGIVDDQCQIGHTFRDGQFFAGVSAMAGPVKGDDGVVLVFARQVFRKMDGSGRVFVAAESVGDDDDVVEGACLFIIVIDEQLAADAVSLLINVEILFHISMPLLGGFVRMTYFISISQKRQMFERKFRRYFMESIKQWLAGSMCFCLLSIISFSGTAAAESPAVLAQSYILVEASTGRVILEKDADVLKYPASMTKMMTAVLALEKLQPETQISILDDAANTEDCPLGFSQGDVFTRDELVGGMLLVSDNGAAVALADRVDGSVPAFAKRMNERAAVLGMKHTHFENPNGLTVPTHYSTARDMMILARYAMENKMFRNMVARKTADVHWLSPAGKHLRAENTNALLGSYPGAIGVKTGWTGESGGCLAAEAERDGTDLLVVLMASPTEGGRFTDARTLLDYGFSHVKTAEGPKADETKHTIWVKDGTTCRTEVKAVQDIRYPLIHGEDASHYSLTYDLPKVISAKETQAGIVGHIIVNYDGQPVGRVDMKAEPIEPGFSVTSWLVGTITSLLGW